jgi:hypothetical protein
MGINDLDVYTFFAAHPDRSWYAKRIKTVDYGDPKFGRSEISSVEFVGRRVDLMARALNVPPGTDVTEALITYLDAPRTGTEGRRATRTANGHYRLAAKIGLAS